MAVRVIRTSKNARAVRFGMTSLIDIAFLLIIFFMLISRFISAENIRLALPKPDDNLARAIELSDRIVLNCLLIPETATERAGVRYLLGPINIADLTELQDRLRAARQTKPDIQIIIRADRDLPYEKIRDALRAVAQAGIGQMNIATELRD